MILSFIGTAEQLPRTASFKSNTHSTLSSEFNSAQMSLNEKYM